MAVRPIDGNELVDTLKQIVSDYTSHGMYPSAFPIEYAIEIVEKMPTLTPPNEWVSVEERLPVEAKKVLCFLGLSSGMMVETGYYMGDDGWYYTGIEAPHHGIVTHWMPLPEPPDRRPLEGEGNA